MFKKLRKNKKMLFILAFLLISTIIFARAGGAGRSSGGGRSSGSFSHSSSSGGGGSIFDLFLLIFLIFDLLMIRYYDPLPVKIIKLVIIIGIIYSVVRYFKTAAKTKDIQKNRYEDPFNNFSKAKELNGEEEFNKRNPNFSKEKFIKKVNKAFMEIQDAWTKKDLTKVRRYISDSVYQRFNVQFEMMNRLGQTDFISGLKIISTVIDKYETDGNYDIIHVAVMASIKDSSKSEKFPALNESSQEQFIEYWSFIRRKNKDQFDMYSEERCPSCGSPLDYDMGEVSKCQNCGVITNKGDYDWVLAEITQMTDYYEEKELRTNKKLKEKLQNLTERYEDFSVQHIEDKISNGYLQILKAVAFNKPEGMRRFVSDDLYSKLTDTKEEFLFSRLYLNYVKLIDYTQEKNKDILAIRIKSSYKRVKINNNKLKILDGFMKSRVEILMLERDTNAINKGDLFSHSCPNCGGPLEDTTDINCPYCGSVLTNSTNDWIIKDILSPVEFGELYKKYNNKITNPFEKNNFSINEMILNNILILICADKEIHKKELEFAKETAKKLGFKESMVITLLELAKQNRLSIKFPKKEKEKTKMLHYMDKAIKADGKISVEEENLIKEMEEALKI